MLKNRHRFLPAAVFIVIVASGFLYVKKHAKPSIAKDPAPESTTASSSETATRAKVPSPSGAIEPSGKRTASAAELQARQQLLDAITKAREERARLLAVPSQPAGPPALESTEAGRAYIRKQMQETLIPLVKECYEDALKQNPTLEGQIILRFTISGEPELGGLVETASVDEEKSTLKDSAMIECARENSYALRFPPPRDGVSIKVEFPLVFKIVDEDKPEDEKAPAVKR